MHAVRAPSCTVVGTLLISTKAPPPKNVHISQNVSGALTREKTDDHGEFPVHAAVQDEALAEHSVGVEAKQRRRHAVLRSHPKPSIPI